MTFSSGTPNTPWAKARFATTHFLSVSLMNIGSGIWSMILFIKRRLSWAFCNSRAFSMALANWSAIICKVSISSSLKALTSVLCTSKAPMTIPRVSKGRAISERVSGKSGFWKCTASSPTSRAMRDWALAVAYPTIELLPTFSRCGVSTIILPTSPVEAWTTAHSRFSSSRNIETW